MCIYGNLLDIGTGAFFDDLTLQYYYVTYDLIFTYLLAYFTYLLYL